MVAAVSRVLATHAGLELPAWVVEARAAAVVKRYRAEKLLVPGFDPNNKPALRPVSDRERELYDRIMLAAKTYAGEPDPPPY